MQKLAVFYVCVILIFASPHAGALDGYAQRRVYEAQQYSDRGNFPQAIKLLTAVNERYPDDVDVLIMLGNCCMNDAADLTNGFKKAEVLFLKATKIDPECGRAFNKLGECHSLRGDYATGIKLFTKAIQVKKPDYNGLRERASAYSNLHRDLEAKQDMELFMRKGRMPGPGRYRDKIDMQMAGIYENVGEYAKALAIYRRMQKDRYEDGRVLREVACLRGMHKPDEALKVLTALISHNKADDIGYLNRARLYESMGKHAQAITDYSTAIDLSPSTTYLKERAAVYDKIGRKDLAERDRKEAERM
ncbi:MAG: tetratricopeptide repeat protein [Candidatus Melainabacteria bacterium]|nr:tetratricopeptide repeat protein [Candidatus Melainabacteria bacterium]